jgi:hypothetical protein
MTVPTVFNTYIKPADGWVALTSAAILEFLRVNHTPHHVPIYLGFGSSAPSLVGTTGTGTVTFSTGVPTAGQTVTIGSETYTFGATRTGPFTVAIAATNLLTATNFTAAVNSDSTVASASDTGGVVTLTSVLLGTVGNVALATNATNVAVSGATLTGGTNPATGFRVDCASVHFDGPFTGNVYARIQQNSNDKVFVSVFAN